MKEDAELSWIGFVTDINKKTGEIMIASQAENLTQGNLILCDRKLFSVQSS